MWKLSSKILFLLVSFAIVTNQSLVNGAKLKCEYGSSSNWWGYDKSVYYCYVQNKEIFTGSRVIIDSVEGSYTGRNTNANVQGVYFYSIPSLKFFPQNLKTIFNNLILICVRSTNLQEITQQDLEPFPKLKSLELLDNKITTIDEDLFKFNPYLEAIVLHKNQIFHIDPNVFDHLDNLNTLRLEDNSCKNALSDAKNSRSEVLKLIQRVRCSDCAVENILEKKKQTHEQAIKAPLLAAIEEKSKEISQLQEKLREAEKSSLERVKTCNDKMIEAKDKYTNIINAKQTEAQKLNEKLHECKDNKEADLKDCNNKYTSLLNAKIIESEKIIKKQNENIRNINEIISSNEEAGDGKVKNIGQKCMTFYYDGEQTPFFLIQ